MKKNYLVVLTLFLVHFAKAQETPLQILEKAVEKIGSIRSLSYESKFTSKNPFSEGDISHGKNQAVLIFDNDGSIKAMNLSTEINEGQTKYREIYLNDTLHTLDLVDSIHSSSKKDKKSISSDMITAVNQIKTILKDPFKIVRNKDTVVNDILCYSFFIKLYDSLINGNHDYTYNYLVIDKTTLMPLYTKATGEGMAEKDGRPLGRLKFFDERSFYNLRINENIDGSIFLFNRSEYSAPNLTMLDEGVLAPDLKLKDLSNHDVALSLFKNKVLLVEFGGTACAANPLANPMLNRLNERYSQKNFSIVSVYSGETSEQVKKYISSNNLQFPVYLGTRKLTKEFKTMGTPNFYLIDRNGIILHSFRGYSDDLEKNLNEKIKVLTNR